MSNVFSMSNVCASLDYLLSIRHELTEAQYKGALKEIVELMKPKRLNKEHVLQMRDSWTGIATNIPQESFDLDVYRKL